MLPDTVPILGDGLGNCLCARFGADENTSAIRNLWVAKAKVATERRDYASAYRCFYSAGWNSLLANEMGDILQAMKSSAEKAGFTGLARLASFHLGSL